jgi:hypothetical protein
LNGGAARRELLDLFGEQFDIPSRNQAVNSEAVRKFTDERQGADADGTGGAEKRDGFHG